MSKDKIICLNKNEANFPLPLSIASAEAGKKFIRFYPQSHNADLYHTLATFHQVAPENLFIANGLEETLLHLFKSLRLLYPNLSAYLPQYTWDYYPSLLHQAHCPDDRITLQSDLTPFDTDTVVQFLSTCKHPTLIILVNPNNPDGQEIPIKDIQNLVTQFPDHIFLIDQAYIGFGQDNFFSPNLTSLAIKAPNLILGRSFSKYLSAPGIRLGYLITSSALLANLRLLPGYLGINHYSVNIALKIINNFSSIDNQNKSHKQIWKKFIDKLNNSSLFESSPLAANFILVKVNKPFNSSRLSIFLKTKGFLIKTYSSHPLDQYIRITLSTADHLNKLLKNLLSFFR